jgi:hypothetical protein
MKYMLLLNRNTDAPPSPGTPEFEDHFLGYTAAFEDMGKAGVFVDAAPLSAVSSTTTVRVRDGETVLTDGPSAEIKELLGGYAIIDCDHLDEAIRWATTVPAAKYASVEIRPLVVVPAQA